MLRGNTARRDPASVSAMPLLARGLLFATVMNVSAPAAGFKGGAPLTTEEKLEQLQQRQKRLQDAAERAKMAQAAAKGAGGAGGGGGGGAPGMDGAGQGCGAGNATRDQFDPKSMKTNDPERVRTKKLGGDDGPQHRAPQMPERPHTEPKPEQRPGREPSSESPHTMLASDMRLRTNTGEGRRELEARAQAREAQAARFAEAKTRRDIVRETSAA